MIKSQVLGGKSNKAFIFLGLFLGLVSAVLVVVYLSSAGGESSGGDTSGAVLTPVVVAKSDIPAGAAITEDNWEQMVEVKEFTSDVVLPGAYRDTGDIVGYVTRVPLVAGEQVIPTKVTATGAAIADVENPPLAYVIPEGKRAVAVEVSSVIGASGLIRAGDYVDVILTVKIGAQEDAEGSTAGGGIHDQLAVTILQNAQVLSVDENVALTAVDVGEGAPAVGEDSEAKPEATTVTLAVSPVHGEVLTVAETCGGNNGGRLALALRPLGDGSQIETRSVWGQDGAPPTCAALLGL
jgi:pilus assembly protein CpaB